MSRLPDSEPRLRIVAWVPYPLGRVASQRYRLEQWAPHLDELGLQVTFQPFLSPRGLDVLYRKGHFLLKASEVVRGYRRRVASLRGVEELDLVWVHREACLLGRPWFETRVAAVRPVAFDFDDAIWVRDTSAPNRWFRRLKPASKAHELCALARSVSAGNEYLADWARLRSPRVEVIPSSIDTDLYLPRQRRPNPRPVVGWTGSLTTASHLQGIGEALRELRRHVDFELRVVGVDLQIPGCTVRCIPWRPETEADDLREIDVGLMPLPDNPWTRGKCGMKALQYMALGIPPVVSPVGANRTIVTDGADGFHARNPHEWTSRVAQLLSDPSLRRTMGTLARRTVEEHYSLNAQLPRVAAVLRRALNGV